MPLFSRIVRWQAWMRRLLAVCTLSAGIATVSPVHADQLMIIGVTNRTVDIYDNSQNYKETMTSKDFLHGRDLSQKSIDVLQVSDKGLLQINDDGKRIWLDSDDVQLNHEKESVITCIKIVRAPAPDKVTAGVLGLNPCTQ